MWILTGFLGLGLLYLLGRIAVMRAPSPTLGLREGVLLPLPTTPNAVASYEAGYYPQGEPFPLSAENWEEEMTRLIALIAKQPRTTLVTHDGRYLHVTFRSAFWGFVDDVEFLAVPERGVIEYRSASRLGQGDLGANQKRIATLRQLFEEDAP